MLRERASYVSVEHVETDIPSGSAIGLDVTSVLLETWCAHKLKWVMYEPLLLASGRKLSDTCEGTSGAYRCQGALHGDKAREGFFCDL